MKTIKKYLIVILIIILACGGTFYWAKTKYETITVSESIDDSGVLDTVTTLTGETIEDGLSDIGELATEEYFFTRVETYDSSKILWNFKIPLTQSKFVYSYDGTVKAGINFADIKVETDNLKKIISVTLPKSIILSCTIDTDTFELYDEKNSVFNPISVSDFNNSLDDMLKAAEKDAIEKGVLERADKNAELLIKNFIMTSYDVDDYYFEIIRN